MTLVLVFAHFHYLICALMLSCHKEIKGAYENTQGNMFVKLNLQLKYHAAMALPTYVFHVYKLVLPCA